MKKIVVIIFCLMILFFAITGCYGKIEGTQGLLETARTEIPIANADDIQLEIVGSAISGERELFWFVSGNENQEHSYFPIEFKRFENEKYSFVKSYIPNERADGICTLLWNDGYCFSVDSPNCQYIVISDGSVNTKCIEVTSIPFVCFVDFIPQEYSFVDYDGNIIE